MDCEVSSLLTDADVALALPTGKGPMDEVGGVMMTDDGSEGLKSFEA